MRRQEQTILTITMAVLALISALLIWKNARDAKKSSDKIMDEFNRVDESLKRSNDSLLQKGVGAFQTDSSP